MTSDTRTPEQIEREIERERVGLTDTLDDLQDRFSAEAMARRFTEGVRDHGGDIAGAVAEAVKRNPVALALTGAGLAWMMFGSGSDRNGAARSVHHHGLHGGHDNARRPASPPPARSFGGRPGDPARPVHVGRYTHPGDLPSWARRPGDDGDDSGLADKASGAARSVADAARGAGSSVADTARDAAGTLADAGASAAGSARGAANAASERAARLRDRLAEGTEDLAEDARQRVIAARERAIEAREAAMDYGRRGRETAADLYADYPLIAGALAVAAGAALGAALPRSETEDAWLGEQSDALMDEAERIFEEEKAKLSRVAGSAAQEARSEAEELGEEAGDAARQLADKARRSGERIAEAAGDEAERQDLGKPGSA